MVSRSGGHLVIKVVILLPSSKMKIWSNLYGNIKYSVYKHYVLTIHNTDIVDFDGDVLNARLIINNRFLEYANNVFNPRNVLFISRNDGMFNNAANHSKDVIINLNTLLLLGRKYYDDNMIAKIQSLKLT